MSNKKAMKEQVRIEKLETEEEKLALAQDLIEVGNHPGMVKLMELLKNHVDMFDTYLRDQYQTVSDGEGGQKRERLTLREIDQMVNSRDAYKGVLDVLNIAHEQQKLSESKIEKLSK